MAYLNALKTTLDDNGKLAYAMVSKNANYTLTGTDETVTVDASGGNKTMTLPTAVSKSGKSYDIKKTDSSANTVTVATTSSQTIDGATTYVIYNQYQSVTVRSDGSNWHIV